MSEPDGKEKLFSYREYFGDAVFREPRKGMSERTGYAFAVVGVLLGLGWIFMGAFSGDFILYLALGAGFMLMFSAEFLPKDRTRLAGYLRMSAYAAAFAALVMLFLPWMGG